MKKDREVVTPKHNTNQGSAVITLLFAVLIGVVCAIIYFWLQENSPAEVPKETQTSITITVTREQRQTQPEMTVAVETTNVAAEPVDQAVLEAQKAAAAAQASLEAALAEANRIAAEAEAARKAAEAEAAKIAAEAEAARVAAAAAEASRVAAEAEAARIAEEASKKAAEEVARKATEPTQPMVKYYGNTKVLDMKEYIIHSPSCELVNSIAEEDKRTIDAGIFELQVQGFLMCESCHAGITDSDSVPFPELPSIGVANLSGIK